MREDFTPAHGSLAHRLVNPGTRKPHRKKEIRRVLHILSQQPSKTGSGIYLNALIDHAAKSGYEQRAVVGLPTDESLPEIVPLKREDILAVRFGSGDIPFLIPGMSDVMPYESTRFSSFTPEMLEAYLKGFERVFLASLDGFAPDLIISHHLWLATALAVNVFQDIPIVAVCHGTDIRQLQLAGQLAPFAQASCSRVDGVMALHSGHKEQIVQKYGIAPGNVHVVGAGYRDDLFYPACSGDAREVGAETPIIVYAGKLSRAKGVFELLDAVSLLKADGRKTRLLLAGSGGGDEAALIREKGAALSEGLLEVEFLGALSQGELAEVFRQADVFILPSYYEGLPLVILEAAACGCAVVVSDLPGMDDWMPAGLASGGRLVRVALPGLIGADVPRDCDLPRYVRGLADALKAFLDARACRPHTGNAAPVCALEEMTWEGIFRKVEKVFRSLCAP